MFKSYTFWTTRKHTRKHKGSSSTILKHRLYKSWQQVSLQDRPIQITWVLLFHINQESEFPLTFLSPLVSHSMVILVDWGVSKTFPPFKVIIYCTPSTKYTLAFCSHPLVCSTQTYSLKDPFHFQEEWWQNRAQIFREDSQHILSHDSPILI
jgi:hypothetical protein